MSLDIHVFTGAFSKNSFQDLNRKSCACVEPNSSTQWKALCEIDSLAFFVFVDGQEFKDKWGQHESSRSIWRYWQGQNGDVDIWTIWFFKNRFSDYIVNILEVPGRGGREHTWGDPGSLGGGASRLPSPPPKASSHVRFLTMLCLLSKHFGGSNKLS